MTGLRTIFVYQSPCQASFCRFGCGSGHPFLGAVVWLWTLPGGPLFRVPELVLIVLLMIRSSRRTSHQVQKLASSSLAALLLMLVAGRHSDAFSLGLVF
ncbi:hypothetical protein V6N13_120544 [Hibiscus sabdariffa]